MPGGPTLGQPLLPEADPARSDDLSAHCSRRGAEIPGALCRRALPVPSGGGRQGLRPAEGEVEGGRGGGGGPGELTAARKARKRGRGHGTVALVGSSLLGAMADALVNLGQGSSNANVAKIAIEQRKKKADVVEPQVISEDLLVSGVEANGDVDVRSVCEAFNGLLDPFGVEYGTAGAHPT